MNTWLRTIVTTLHGYKNKGTTALVGVLGSVGVAVSVGLLGQLAVGAIGAITTATAVASIQSNVLKTIEDAVTAMQDASDSMTWWSSETRCGTV